MKDVNDMNGAEIMSAAVNRMQGIFPDEREETLRGVFGYLISMITMRVAMGKNDWEFVEAVMIMTCA